MLPCLYCDPPHLRTQTAVPISCSSRLVVPARTTRCPRICLNLMHAARFCTATVALSSEQNALGLASCGQLGIRSRVRWSWGWDTHLVSKLEPGNSKTAHTAFVEVWFSASRPASPPPPLQMGRRPHGRAADAAREVALEPPIGSRRSHGESLSNGQYLPIGK